jgi:hypothetical protein
VRCPDLLGAHGVRVVQQRTSNAYHFNDPGGAGAASNLNKKSVSARKSEKPTGTPNQVFSSLLWPPAAASGPAVRPEGSFAREGRRISLRYGAF